MGVSNGNKTREWRKTFDSPKASKTVSLGPSFNPMVTMISDGLKEVSMHPVSFVETLHNGVNADVALKKKGMGKVKNTNNLSKVWV